MFTLFFTLFYLFCSLFYSVFIIVLLLIYIWSMNKFYFFCYFCYFFYFFLFFKHIVFIDGLGCVYSVCIVFTDGLKICIYIVFRYIFVAQ